MTSVEIPAARDLCRACLGDEQPHFAWFFWPVEFAWTADERAALLGWLAEHDVDGNDVCAVALNVTINNGASLHTTVYVSGEEGGRIVDLARDEAVTRPVVVPLRSLPPTPGFCRDHKGREV